MSNLKFIVGPPGTGKTHIYLKSKYKDLLKTYSPEKMILLSHTNVAADEIREAVEDLPEIKNMKLEENLRFIVIKYYLFLSKVLLLMIMDHQNGSCIRLYIV